MARKNTSEDQAELIATIKADFDARLARMAAEPQQWAQFVENVATFGAQYSLGNQLLLIMQAEKRGITPRFFLPYGNKDATTGWRAHGRQVRTGEKAFKIWAPVKRRPSEEQAAGWEAEGRTVRRDAAGRPVLQVVGFRLANTFELGQTDGEPFEVPTLIRTRRVRVFGTDAPQLLCGDDPTGAFDDVVDLITAEGYTFALVAPGAEYLGDANGVTVASRHLVQVRDDVDAAQRLKTTVHELAHIRCGHTTGLSAGESLHRGRRETEAESVAHVVCGALGLDSRSYSDAYVLGWAEGDMELVKQCAQTVLRVAKQILQDLTPGDTGVTDDSSAASSAVPAG